MSGFLELPAELRVRIYSYVFTNNLRYQKDKTWKLDRRICGLNVLGTCHTTRYEAAPLLKHAIEAKLKSALQREKAHIPRPRSREKAEVHEVEEREADEVHYLAKEIISGLLLRVARACRHYGMGSAENGI